MRVVTAMTTWQAGGMSSVTPVLDHLVLATSTLEATADRITGALGCRAVPGGSHVGRGTRNILMSLSGGSYLEIIGTDEGQPAPSAPRPFGVDDLHGERLVTWAVRVHGIDGLCAKAAAVGYDPGPVASMSRVRPDGVTLNWRLTAPPAAPVSVVPFFIDWAESPHPAQSLPDGCRLVGLRAEHPRADVVSAQFAALGLSIPLRQAPLASLVAVLEGPGGRIDLR